ncbi:uncharacterized protein LOC119828695 [Zerene cesonia]|uniref:uncharacterized protein LOC119828695 n=1 Tax=Zerene cesonia TaxID=33412 RepID=UPI0018E4FF5F|nr:uncharacterized protein LOC119828695 [Zerene cesonia]
MVKLIAFLFIQYLLIIVCSSDITVEKKNKILNGFIDFLNNLPNHPYVYDEGTLQNAQQEPNSDVIHIEVALQGGDEEQLYGRKTVQCTADIIDLLEAGISVQNQPQCQEVQDVTTPNVNNEPNIEDPDTTVPLHEPIHLDNEEQPEGVTSGEQFIAVPRRYSNASCAGCADHVNPNAPGVEELALLAVKHLDKHEPATKHTLRDIVDVERQVQVVNGIKYTLTLNVIFNNCTPPEEFCNENVPCKISILEKTWIKYPDGSKYRAITSNNCTEQWQFGDDGEEITDNHDNAMPNSNNADHGEYIHAKANSALDAQPSKSKIIPDEVVKNIEEQIIPYKETESSKSSVQYHPNLFNPDDVKSQHVKDLDAMPNYGKVQFVENHAENQRPLQFLTDEKKKAVDDLINFFNSAGFDFNAVDKSQRAKRSFYNDLKVLAIVEKFHKLKENLNNANFIYSLAQNMVDYLNEIDLEIKNRYLQEVISAEEENENYQHFFYIQARVIIPCDKLYCDDQIKRAKICNGVIESIDGESPHILTTFCYDDVENPSSMGKSMAVPLDDPLLKKMIDKAIKKIESDSLNSNAISLKQVLAATTRRGSGAFTKVLIEIVFTNCNKTLSFKKRDKCTILNSLGSNICEIIVFERYSLKEKDMTTTCTPRNTEETFSKSKERQNFNQNHNDPVIAEMVQQALKQIELDSNQHNKQRVLQINSITTQIFAGLLTEINFLVGYTTCITDTENDIDEDSCPLNNEPPRKCQAVIWDRPWLEDGRQLNVSCNSKNILVNNSRRKRFTQLLGGVSTKDPNDPIYLNLAKESLNNYFLTSGASQQYERLQVKKVTTQVVAGTLTKIEFEATGQGNVITCHSAVWDRPWLKKKEYNVTCKTDNIQVNKVTTQVVAGTLTKIDFEATGQGNVITCHSEIWDRPWMKKKEITHVTCQTFEKKFRTKRTLRGGKSEENPLDPRFIYLAKESLRKYQLLKKIRAKHEVISVKRVYKQVVSGIIYKIDFIAARKSCPSKIKNCRKTEDAILYCHSKVWDRPWLNNKEITVDCYEGDENEDSEENDRKKRHVYSEISKKGHANDENNKILLEGPIQPNKKIREKRQAEEDYIDEDTKYYYADRAIQLINEKSDTNNLQKMITIHSFQSGTIMDVNMVRMYIETAYTFCLRNQDDTDLTQCEELPGMYHKLCLVRIWPSPDDELVIQQIHVVCNDEKEFETVTGISTRSFIEASIKELEASPKIKTKIINLGEPNVIPSLDSRDPTKVNFMLGFTNCSKDVDLKQYPNCDIDTTRPYKTCTSHIWLAPYSNKIKKLNVNCMFPNVMRKKRAVTLSSTNATSDEITIQHLVKESLEKLEMSSIHKFKQRVLQINSYSSKITSGRVTTIDFDVGYTSCLKYEWVENITNCAFLEHLPRRHCISTIWERLWLDNGKQIDVNCQDDETPIEAHVEFENPEHAMQLAKQALKHIEAKYPNPLRQKVIRIFSMEKQTIAGVHYRMKIEVGNTNCPALSMNDTCELVSNMGLNKFCRVNVWIRPWTEHPPNYRVSCDFQDGATTELYRHVQAERLFYDFITTYRPDYMNNHDEMLKRFEIFKDNVRRIHEFNIREQGTARYAVTRFTDLSYEEFAKKYLGLKLSLRDPNQIPFRKADIPDVKLPDKFDWRDHGAVTNVKNQGSCGSCWAFSVTGNIEGQWKIQTGELVSLSEQELVDCDKLDEGCNGGLPDNAYRAIEQLGGLETESDYPYEGVDDKCAYNKTLSKVHIRSALNISSNETEMAKWLVQNGPISIGINANAMQFYVGGVSHPWRMLCNPKNLDHGVLIVGYGAKDYPLFHKHLPYWIIKNSWGKEWGEQGYYRVYRGDGTCGVNMMASSAVV